MTEVNIQSNQVVAKMVDWRHNKSLEECKYSTHAEGARANG